MSATLSRHIPLKGVLNLPSRVRECASILHQSLTKRLCSTALTGTWRPIAATNRMKHFIVNDRYIVGRVNNTLEISVPKHDDYAVRTIRSTTDNDLMNAQPTLVAHRWCYLYSKRYSDSR